MLRNMEGKSEKLNEDKYKRTKKKKVPKKECE